MVEQTLSNWVKAHRAGRLKEVGGKAGVTAEQMEISRLRAEIGHGGGGSPSAGIGAIRRG